MRNKKDQRLTRQSIVVGCRGVASRISACVAVTPSDRIANVYVVLANGTTYVGDFNLKERKRLDIFGNECILSTETDMMTTVDV